MKSKLLTFSTILSSLYPLTVLANAIFQDEASTLALRVNYKPYTFAVNPNKLFSTPSSLSGDVNATPDLIIHARIQQSPSGLSSYKCFFTSREPGTRNIRYSPLFSKEEPLTEPFNKPDSLFCHNFVDGKAYVAVVTEDGQLLMVTAEQSLTEDDLTPASIIPGQTVNVHSARIMQASHPRTRCLLIPANGEFEGYVMFDVQNPLPSGLYPDIEFLACDDGATDVYGVGVGEPS